MYLQKRKGDARKRKYMRHNPTVEESRRRLPTTEQYKTFIIRPRSEPSRRPMADMQTRKYSQFAKPAWVDLVDSHALTQFMSMVTCRRSSGRLCQRESCWIMSLFDASPRLASSYYASSQPLRAWCLRTSKSSILLNGREIVVSVLNSIIYLSVGDSLNSFVVIVPGSGYALPIIIHHILYGTV